MAIDVMSSMSNQNLLGSVGTQTDMPGSRNRYMGGHRRTNHPYISGYWYAFFDVPRRIFSTSTSDPKYYESAEKWLHSAAEGFTPPTRTLTKVDLPGMGGMGSSFIAGQELSRTFTVTFREFQYLPLMSIFNTWTSVIDPHLGASPLSGDEYIPANYKGNAYIVLAKPVASLTHGKSELSTPDNDLEHTAEAGRHNFIEQIYYFHGVFPESAPHDAFSTDIATNESAQLSVSFSFDGWALQRDNDEITEQLMKKIRLDETRTFGGNFEDNFLIPIGTTNSPTVWGKVTNI